MMIGWSAIDGSGSGSGEQVLSREVGKWFSSNRSHSGETFGDIRDSSAHLKRPHHVRILLYCIMYM